VTAVDPISDLELNAYVDDQLGMSRRIEVEEWLAQNPDIAARVMADLRSRDALRMVLATPQPPPEARTLDAAHRLKRELRWAWLAHQLRRGAVAAAFVAAGWFVHAQIGPLGVADSEASLPPPAYVEDAVRSHRTTLLRARMYSQPTVPDYDPEDIRLATQIIMPTLPQGWRVLDVQVYPSREGPSVQMMVQTSDLNTLSLFSVRTSRAGMISLSVAQIDADRVAYWRTGHLAYALTGRMPGYDLERVARELAESMDQVWGHADG
jgi:anti-sigma factor RsiW